MLIFLGSPRTSTPTNFKLKIASSVSSRLAVKSKFEVRFLAIKCYIIEFVLQKHRFLPETRILLRSIYFQFP